MSEREAPVQGTPAAPRVRTAPAAPAGSATPATPGVPANPGAPATPGAPVAPTPAPRPQGDVLAAIAAHAVERVAAERAQRPLAEVRAAAERVARDRYAAGERLPFERALRRPGMSFICEVKRASPSKGLIAPDFDYLGIARDYERAGAAAISCLTEPRWFLGSDAYLEQIARAVHVPVLRKDFVVDEYMVYAARALGASAVLLICALLDDAQLRAFRELADELGMSALVEAHDEREIERALDAGARVVGVNNRDLRTFAVDLDTSRRLRTLVPPDVAFVSESGYAGPAEVARSQADGVDAILVGEALMRAPDKAAALAELRGTAGVRGVHGTGAPSPSPASHSARAPRVKLCGLTSAADVAAANAAEPDYAGFVVEVPQSRRSVNVGQLRELAAGLDPTIAAVGVFVDAPVELVAGLLNEGVLDVAQLHGHEGPAYLGELMARTDRPIIQAFRVRGPDDVAAAQASAADLVLLDAGAGEGRAFDWELARACTRPYLLAGGLTPQNLREAIGRARPWGVDMSSGIETDGVKDPQKMSAAVAAVRSEA